MSWLEPLDLAIKLYNDGDNQACIEQVDSMLTDTLPLYPRIRCRILLGHTLDDWVEAEEERYKAEITLPHWLYSRRPGNEARTEEVYKELRGLLDNLAEELRSWRPVDWYEHQRFWTDTDAEDRDAAITKATEEWQAEQTKGEEEVAVEQAEGVEEKIAEQAEGQEDEAAEQGEGEEEIAAGHAKVKEENADDALSP